MESGMRNNGVRSIIFIFVIENNHIMKTIIITGASSGIGEQTALLFANKGWRVAATMRNPKSLTMFAGHANIKTYPMDVTDPPSIEAAIGQIIKDFGHIDVLVNNAGVYTTDPLEASTDAIIDSVVDTNIKGVLLTARAVIPHFRENRAGVLVNVSSVAGRVTIPFQSIYHTSKWAVEGFSEDMRYELAPLGVRVKIIEPGVVKTPLYRDMDDAPVDNYPQEYREPFTKWWAFIKKSTGNGYSPAREAATIWRAVNSRGSKLRYTTDLQTRTLFCLRRLLPARTFQWLVGRISGIR